ncbi:unnamed protein product [Lepeophtheirus salmonis]|uniref:(salmon louse) hypothetical protein n=1 Tax=Lepeophtheirus salmonis TaxID=72036 RepID=A0A7R8CF69_LEPSM|nr:unnamed protein product [Lepeophtheirus salmonis]CAF2803505.1 unnamed protein product [Lepeophtheirus salmonis]
MKLHYCICILLPLWTLSSPIFSPTHVQINNPQELEPLIHDNNTTNSTPPSFVPSQQDMHRKPDYYEDYYVLVDSEDLLSEYDLLHKDGPLFLYDDEEVESDQNQLYTSPEELNAYLASRGQIGVQKSFLDEAFPYVMGGAIVLLASTFITNHLSLDPTQSREHSNGLVPIPTLDTMFPFLHNLVRSKRDLNGNSSGVCQERYICQMKGEVLEVLREWNDSSVFEDLILSFIGKILHNEWDELNLELPCEDIRCNEDEKQI